MNKLHLIVLDGIILFAASTCFVLFADFLFGGLKGKVPADDPLVTAIVQGDGKALDAKLGDGFTPDGNRDQTGRTALMRAAYANLVDSQTLAKTDDARAKMAARLIETGADVNLVDQDGWSALMWASWSGLRSVADVLLRQGADPNLADRRGNTALMLAARRCKPEIISLLLQHGADQTAVNHEGRNARDMARLGSAESSGDYQPILDALESPSAGTPAR